MEGRMKGQFYVVAGFVISMYLFFLSQIMTSIELSGRIPQEEVPVDQILTAFQEMVDAGETNLAAKIDLLYDTIASIPESVSVICDGGCEQEFADWACGIQVTVQYTEKSISSKSSFVQSRYDFVYNAPRKPIKVTSNESGKLVNITITAPSDFKNPALLVHRGTIIPANWSTDITARINMVKDSSEIVYVYNITGSDSYIFRDVGVLDEEVWDGAALISAIESSWGTEAMTISELVALQSSPRAGPRVILIPEIGYPLTALNALKTYVKTGGVLAVVGGLCHGYCSGTPWYECDADCSLVSEETVTDGHWITAKSPFNTSWDPVLDFNSSLFASTTLRWFVYDSSTGENQSRSAVGAVRYGEGYLVYVGNESWFDPSWGNFTESINDFLGWAIGSPSITSSSCPTQAPT
ncbi:MAG: hypothetical protein GOU99_02585 [Candidatus Altiarchaeota archaeon]|nr:hypothetical protein [Candidatus Altiarchaeota archaeon]